MKGMRKLNKKERKVVKAFCQHMQDVVIPRMVENQRERAQIVVDTRNRILL